MVPEGLNLLAPGEQVSVDFCSYLKQDILMVKDSVSGMIWSRATRNQTSQEAFTALMEWYYRLGMPHEVGSDGAESFRASFTNLLKEVGINHVHTSPYNSKSNGGMERSVRSIKDVLRRENIKKVTQQKLDKICYLINQHPYESSGTPAERFFGHSPRSCLPNSLTRFVDHSKLIEARKAKQVEMARSKGRSAPNDFREGDLVFVQDLISKKWNIPGTIKQARSSEDDTARSFVIERDDGSSLLRN